jgi:hypothetical protein
MPRKIVWGVAVVGAISMGSLLHAGGCVKDVEVEGTGICAPTGNPCVEVRCPGGGVTEEGDHLPDTTPCKLGINPGRCKAGVCDLTCDGKTQNPKNCSCGEDIDCPLATPCQVRMCGDAGKCVPRFPKGTPCNDDAGVCSMSGECVTCIVGESTGCNPDEICQIDPVTMAPTCFACESDGGSPSDAGCGPP